MWRRINISNILTGSSFIARWSSAMVYTVTFTYYFMSSTLTNGDESVSSPKIIIDKNDVSSMKFVIKIIWLQASADNLFSEHKGIINLERQSTAKSIKKYRRFQLALIVHYQKKLKCLV